MKVKLTAQLGHSVLMGYERKNQKFLKDKIKPGMTVYDVGANCGQMALLFSKLVTGKGSVIAFEPVDFLFKQLAYNVKLNKLQNVLCRKTALGNVIGKSKFLYSATQPTMGKIKDIEPRSIVRASDEIDVDTETLDSLLGQLPPPDVIKIDAEGSAGLILEGAAQLLKTYGPSFFIELHDSKEVILVQTRLKNAEYIIENLNGSRIRDLAKEQASPVWCARRSQ